MSDRRTSTPQSDRDPLAARMARVGLREEDLEETFVRARGHGGQNVNKVATCVVLLHRPTGLQVKCQDSRQQGRNRLLARQVLLDKLEAKQREERRARRAQAEKLRRQKRKRSRAAQERILADKAHQSRKKENRRRVSLD